MLEGTRRIIYSMLASSGLRMVSLYSNTSDMTGLSQTVKLYNICQPYIGVTTVPRSYISRSTFRICPSFSSMTSLTFYDLLLLTHAYDFHMLTISHVYDFHMLTVFTCFSFTYFVRLPCTIKTSL